MRSAVSLLIRDCVEQYGDPLLDNIVRSVEPRGYTRDEIQAEVLVMVNRGELRMKDDDIDHDWTYRRGHNWDDIPKEKSMMLKMLNDRVAIELDEPEKKTPGGIVLPDSVKGKSTRGVVVGVGPGNLGSEGARVPLLVEEGDRVIIGQYIGDEVEVGEKVIRVVREDDILAKVE